MSTSSFGQHQVTHSADSGRQRTCSKLGVQAMQMHQMWILEQFISPGPWWVPRSALQWAPR